MRNKFLLLAFLLFFSFSAFAQIQSEQGKVFLIDGQVIEGKIAYFYDSPLIINVYDAANNKQTFEPRDIDKITLDNGKRFVAKEYKSPFETSTLIFQEVVVSDKITLYKREAANLEFYVSTGDELIKLENNETTIADHNGKRYKKMDHKYVGTLTILMQDRTDLIEKIQKTEFNEKSLAAIVAAYNNGNLSYYFASEVEVEKKPYFQAYAHYTNYATHYSDETSGTSWGFQAGAQYYFSSESRNSVRIGLDISNYEFDTEISNGRTSWAAKSIFSYKTLSFKYQYDFVKQEKLKLYFLFHILDIGQMNHELKDSQYKSVYKFDPETVYEIRLSPGTGIEYNATEKVSLFADINYLLNIKYVPKNFSVGLKYTYRKP